MTEPFGEGDVYRVCSACHRRLVARELRPLEWYNLAKRHGWWQFLLHDDFYAEDGTGYQPEGEIETPELYPAPTLDMVRDDPDALLDYTITRWHLSPEVAAAWQALDRSEIVETLARRNAGTTNGEIRLAMLEVAACSLAEQGAGFVTAAWNDYTDPRQLSALAQASAACLPYDVGFSRVVAALSALDEKARRESMHALGYFHSRDTLDWIEENVDSPVTDNWGRLAAASLFHWLRAVAWLKKGRPLSLVALDAMAEIVRPQTPFLRNYGPSLDERPDPELFQRTLTDYKERDSAPRVKKMVDFLIENSGPLVDN